MSLTPDEAGTWRRIRRWAVPPAMIRAATEARLAGDWRAACVAANVDVEPGDYTPFEDDLRHFAPDLLRWHLPRSPTCGDTHLDPRRAWHLAGSGPALYVGGTRLGFGSQRLRLFTTGEPIDPHQWDDWDREEGVRPYFALHDLRDRRHLWHAGESAGLLRVTCGWPHLAGYEPDGTPRPDAGDTERILALQDEGRHCEAWAVAGVDVPEPVYAGPGWSVQRLRDAWEGFRPDLPAVVAAARSLGRDSVRIRFTSNDAVELTGFGRARLRGEWISVLYSDTDGFLDTGRLELPVDVHLVRLGVLRPEALHPLVHLAFFPLGKAPAAPPEPEVQVPDVRVRCGGQWHTIGMAHGRFTTPHTDEERQRERTLRALGGTSTGCFAAETGWRDTATRLPRALRAQQRDLMLRAQHGDHTGVVALLDAGIDPHARDPHGRTLLHHITGLMRTPEDLYLFRRLVGAGLDLEARDRRGTTPLHTAVYDSGSPTLVRAFLAAGATPDTVDDCGRSLSSTLEWYRRPELQFLDDLL